MRGGPKYWATLVLAGVVLGAVASLLVGGDAPPGGGPVAGSTAGPEAAADPPGLTSDEVRDLQAALSSQDPQDVTSVFAEAVAPAYAGSRDAVLPEGSSVTVEEGTFVASGASASVALTVSGPEPGRWLLVLVREADRWRAVGTQPL